jgi:hypothetical protein
MTAAEKQRHYRKRLRCGMAVLRVELPVDQVIEALLRAERLTELQALDRAA